MIELALIRHGPTEWNEQRRIQGLTDIPLSANGRAVVKSWKLPVEFHGFRLIAGPLVRAMETARILIGEPQPEPRLTEMNWGEWEGLSSNELNRRFPRAVKESERLGLNFRRPGGESPRDVQIRLAPWLASLNEPTVAVSHQGVINAVYALAVGWDMIGKPPLRLIDGAAHLFVVNDEGTPHIRRLNIPLKEAAP
ncbi:MAG: phosphoglycerate mutase [Rhodospirillales bacterium RIFCSPLOWO2_12_FULL_58_28]|nr:MAG: phosphoglycerate mutase [Rhodospirillales bacterium RIFCSPLOWO2_02_FULL_58_16]OHC76918.1 MAG: phosphoglycerate mutase [Rhodospirillales bacterium RIFCSPLOWO2_12_FULL_58_28]